MRFCQDHADVGCVPGCGQVTRSEDAAGSADRSSPFLKCTCDLQVVRIPIWSLHPEVKREFDASQPRRKLSSNAPKSAREVRSREIGVTDT